MTARRAASLVRLPPPLGGSNSETKMQNITYEERAVAFIDVLGFSMLVDNSVHAVSAREELQSLVDMLETSIPLLNNGVCSTVPARLIPKHTYVSDSIILSAPIADPEFKHYSGLDILIMRCIQLSHRFLGAGYLLRGGIAVGNVWHSDGNIVGPAYQEAYRLEATGENPCIVLSESAKEYWVKGFGGGSRMCVRDRETLIVNGLHDFYIVDKSHGGIERTFEEYKRIVDDNLVSELPISAKAKWNWFKSFLEQEQSEAANWVLSP